MKPYYQDESITLYHGDCLQYLRGNPSFDLVVTSPPYNLGDMSGGLANLAGGYRSYSDSMPDDKYVCWQQSVLSSCWSALPENGAIFYNHKPIVRDGVVSLPTRLIPAHVSLRQIIVWYRQIGVNWSPTHFLPVHEWVLLLAKPAFRLKDKSASHVSDVWAIRPELKASEHPAPFPLELPSRAIAATDAAVVFDPFAGSGTTLRAAKDLGRKAVGVEMDERYCEIAARRCSQEVLDLGVA